MLAEELARYFDARAKETAPKKGKCNMAFTRKYLKGLGLTDDQIDAVMEAHTDVTDGMKATITDLTEKASAAAELQKKVDELQGGEDWKSKYTALKKSFDDYKSEAASREKLEKVKAAYTQLLKEAQIDGKRIDAILRVTDMSGMELDENGHLKDADKLTESIKSEWSAFIQSTGTKGAQVATPPSGSGTHGGKTREEILAIKDTAERQRAIAENRELFGIR